MDGVHLIFGATSGIGQALAHKLAASGATLILSARDLDLLEKMASDLRIRYNTTIHARPLNVCDLSIHESYLQGCLKLSKQNLQGVTCCQGFMADQETAQSDFELAKKMIDVNFVSNVSLLNWFANYFESKGKGYICGVSSVAGDRGRQSNYLYGCTKAALTQYLQGLRNRLFRKGVAVITIKPGFVDTGMTWGLLDPESPMVATPDKVADDIMKAISKRKNEIYTPRFWRIIMTIIGCIPERIFKRLSL